MSVTEIPEQRELPQSAAIWTRRSLPRRVRLTEKATRLDGPLSVNRDTA